MAETPKNGLTIHIAPELLAQKPVAKAAGALIQALMHATPGKESKRRG